MTDQYVSNFAIPATTNVFQLIWKLTRAMKAAGWTTQASSDGVNKDTSGVAANDKWGGSVNPLSDVYVTNTNNLTDATSGGWIAMRGPSTVKVPLSAAPTGTFRQGETVTQATSGAEGELLGYVWDPVGLSGWAVILPHTGTFDNSHVVTGSSSGATFTPTGTVVTYVREIVISRDTSSVANAKINGWIWYICADVSGESAQLPTTLAAAAGCTATISPGAGGTGNAFPAKGILIKGTSTTQGFTGWVTSSTTTFVATSNGQIFAKNATPAAGVSADGSFGCVCSSTAVANAVAALMFTRVDDGEPGDVDPYVWWDPITATASNFNNSTNSTSIGAVANVAAGILGTHTFLGYVARGCPVTTRDIPGYWFGTDMFNASGGTTSYWLQSSGTATSKILLNHPNASPPVMRAAIFVTNNGNSALSATLTSFKGRLRWLQMVNTGNCYDTYDTKAWLLLGPASSGNPCIMWPYDGSTTPIQ